jgi:hypothetical protein
MTDVNRRLRDADPLQHETAPSAEDRARMRRTILAASESEPVRSVRWGRAVAIAAAAVLVAGGGLMMNRQAAVRPSSETAAEPIAAPVPGARTQVQFSTPGGTRIVWTIDPSFHIKGTR